MNKPLLWIQNPIVLKKEWNSWLTLFHYPIAMLWIGLSFVMLRIFLDHFIGYFTRTPGTVADRPKMTAPYFLCTAGNSCWRRPEDRPFNFFTKTLKEGGYSTWTWIWSLLTTPFRIRTFSESHIPESRFRQRYLKSPWRIVYLYFVAQTIWQLKVGSKNWYFWSHLILLLIFWKQLACIWQKWVVSVVDLNVLCLFIHFRYVFSTICSIFRRSFIPLPSICSIWSPVRSGTGYRSGWSARWSRSPLRSRSISVSARSCSVP